MCIRDSALVPDPAEETSGVPVMVIQVTNEEQAKAQLPKLFGSSPVLATVHNGYAVMCDSTDADKISNQLKVGTLADKQTFTGDFRSLGNPGWVAGWIDGAGLGKLRNSGTAGSYASLASGGRVAAVLRFTNDTAQLVQKSFGLDPSTIPTVKATTDVGGLPADTGMVISAQRGRFAVHRLVEQLPEDDAGAGLHRRPQQRSGSVIARGCRHFVG
jgi:hypothetical protein